MTRLPGRLFLTAAAAEVAGHFGAATDVAALPAEFAAGEAVPAVVLDGGRRLVAMRWGLIPMGRTNARGRPVLETIVNARSETLFAKSAFAGLSGAAWCRRAAGTSGPASAAERTRWAIRAPGEPILALAAVWDRWRAPGGAEVASLATVTCPPSAEVAAVHDRMPVILRRRTAWPVWLRRGRPGGSGADGGSCRAKPLADGAGSPSRRGDGRVHGLGAWDPRALGPGAAGSTGSTRSRRPSWPSGHPQQGTRR